MSKNIFVGLHSANHMWVDVSRIIAIEAAHNYMEFTIYLEGGKSFGTTENNEKGAEDIKEYIELLISTREKL